ncbi:MAG: sugar ABC transporter substrate-binding protein [Geminicoccaceae bacterium]
MLRKSLTSILALAAFTATAGGALAEDKVALIMSDIGSANPFWAAVSQGAIDKGGELGVDVATVGPPGGETDIAGQIALVEDQTAKGVKGIAISPADTAALIPALEQARARGVAVLFVDKRADMPGTYIGTNNIPAATLGAQHICDNVESGSDVAILQGIITGTTGQHRAQGAREGLEACGMNIVAEQPADWDTAKAQNVTENILTANPNLKAIFSSNDNMALGAIEAVRNAGKLDDIFIVGFDGNPNAAEAILAGDLEASVAQRPYNMGQMGVENVLKLAAGETLPEEIDTGAILVTTENAEEFK